MKNEYHEPRLMQQVQRELCKRGCLPETQRAYCRVIIDFIRYHKMTHPKHMGYKELEDFLDHLSKDLGHAPSSRNKALNAVLFLYRRILGRNVQNWHKGLKSAAVTRSADSGGGRRNLSIRRLLFFPKGGS